MREVERGGRENKAKAVVAHPPLGGEGTGRGEEGKALRLPQAFWTLAAGQLRGQK